jgi:hypothetical protein
MKRIPAFVIFSLLISGSAHAADEHFVRYYGEHEIVGSPTDVEAVKTMLDESVIPSRAVADGFISRLDGEFPIDPDKRRSEAIIDFVSRHRAAFGLMDPREEIGILLEEPAKVPFQEERAGQPADMSLFVQFISRESSAHRLRVYTVEDSIVRVESDLKPTFDYAAMPKTSPYEALNRAMFELGGEESDYYGHEILITLKRGDEGGAYASFYAIDFVGGGVVTRVRINADTGKAIDVEHNAEPRPRMR